MSNKITVYFFEGQENIDPADTFEMDDWSVESAITLISTHIDNWLGETVEYIDGSVLMEGTVYIISPNLIQAVADPVDGGMFYIVRKS